MLTSQQKITPDYKDLMSGLFNKKVNEKEKINKKGQIIDKIISDYIPSKYFYWFGSGREALRQILMTVQFEKEKTPLKIGVPAYTCQVVLGAVKKAGCEPVFYDSGVVADVGEIKKIIKEVDALILSYNFGFLPEVGLIAKLCKENKVILIEDCAQALGATYRGKPAGSWGDYAFYSFGISKNIGFCGGLIASPKEIKVSLLREYPRIKLFKLVGEILASPLFFHKSFYPFFKNLLKKELAKEPEDLSYALPPFAQKIIFHQFKRYEFILKKRERNGLYCLQELEQVNFVKPALGSRPAWLYFVFLVENKSEFKRELEKRGVEVGEMITFKCLDGKGKKALEAEKKVLTFALYRHFKEVKHITDILKKVCEVGNYGN